MITQRIDLSGPPLTRQFLQSLCFVCASFFTVGSAFADELTVDSTPITGGTATFTFDIQGSVSGLEFRVGKQGDSKAYYDSEDDSSFSNATREVTVTNLPTDGEDIRARLNYNWQSSEAGDAVSFASTAGTIPVVVQEPVQTVRL